MRIGIIAILHESNTFSSQPTTEESFRHDLWLEGDAIRRELAEAHHEVGGFFAGLESVTGDGVEVVPLLAARALPAGTIDGDTWELLNQRMLQLTRAAGKLDGILLALHGAAVSRRHADADGAWIASLRRELGADPRIVGTLDLHGNVSPAMVRASDGWVAYRTNPHLDQRDRGIEAAELLVRSLRGEIQPTMSAVLPPLAVSIQQQCTREEPLARIYAEADQQLHQPGVLSNSVLPGFPYADVSELGAATITITDRDPELADRLAGRLAQELWQRREVLNGKLISVNAALRACQQHTGGRICLLDMGDNVGGGSSADGTQLIAALHRQQLGPSFACLYDPDSVAACASGGIGSTLQLLVGGKTDSLHGQPLALAVRVRSLHAGKFREDQPRHGGIVEFDQGTTAIVDIGERLTLMLTSRRMVPFSLQQLRSCQIDPSSFRILVAKGVNAPIAAYQEVCEEFIRVDTVGSTSADLSRLVYHRRRRPMYPFEPETSWDFTASAVVRGFRVGRM